MTSYFAGIGAGFDTATIVQNMVSAARAPITALTAKQQQVTAATQTFNTLSTKLSTLRSAAQALSDTDGFSSFSATSSDPAVVASVSGMTMPGAYDVNVTAVAQEQRTYSDTQTSSTTPLGMSGTVTLNVGAAAPVDVTVEPTDTLTDIADKLSSSGARLRASILYDGSTYRLLVRGLDTGAQNATTFTETGLDLGLSKPENTYQKAQDCALSVDGMSVTRPTNQIADVIPGVSLAITKVTTLPAVLRVGTDTTALKQKMQSFVAAYNDLVASSHAAAGFGGTKAQNPMLAGDTTVRTVLDRFGAVMASAVPGATGAYTALGSVGLALQSDATLKFDGAKFDAAMTADPTSTARLFVTDTATGATGAMKTFATLVDSMTIGSAAPVRNRIDSLASQNRKNADALLALEARSTQYEASLKTQFASLDATVSRYRSIMQSIGGATSSGSSGQSGGIL